MSAPLDPSASSSASEAEAAGADLVERVVDSRTVHRGRYLSVRVDTIERADGSRSLRDIVGHDGAVAIVAIDDQDRVVLVRQFRLAAGRVLTELPAGGLDRDDDGQVEDPLLAGKRELEEETGLRAGSWRPLARILSAPGFTEEEVHIYVATDLVAAGEGRLNPEADEHLQVERVPFADAVAAVIRGEIVDSKSVIGLLWVDRERRGGAPR